MASSNNNHHLQNLGASTASRNDEGYVVVLRVPSGPNTHSQLRDTLELLYNRRGWESYYRGYQSPASSLFVANWCLDYIEFFDQRIGQMPASELADAPAPGPRSSSPVLSVSLDGNQHNLIEASDASFGVADSGFSFDDIASIQDDFTGLDLIDADGTSIGGEGEGASGNSGEEPSVPPPPDLSTDLNDADGTSIGGEGEGASGNGGEEPFVPPPPDVSTSNAATS